MDNKAFISNQYLTTLLQDSTISSDNIFMNAIFEHALPSGFSFLTTTESGTFNPNNYCVNKSTWTYSEITVVNNNCVVTADGSFNLIDYDGSSNGSLYMLSGTGEVKRTNTPTSTQLQKYKSGIKIDTTNATLLYKWIKA